MLPNRPTVLAAFPGILAAVLTVLGGLRPAVGDDFRIENKVFAVVAGKTSTPESQGTTIFHSGRVYDFLDNPAEVVVLDPAARRFILLDTGRRLVAEVKIEKVVALNEWQKEWATAQPSPVIQFFGKPQFEETFNKGTSELTLKSPWVIYKIELAPAGKGMMEQYREFSDWYARLNAVLIARSRPPFARLMVNEAIASHRAIPREIELTLVAEKGKTVHRTVIRSQHELIQPLVKADLDRIDAVQQNIKAFQAVSFEKYCKRD